jgi:hypothetical protein
MEEYLDLARNKGPLSPLLYCTEGRQKDSFLVVGAGDVESSSNALLWPLHRLLLSMVCRKSLVFGIFR